MVTDDSSSWGLRCPALHFGFLADTVLKSVVQYILTELCVGWELTTCKLLETVDHHVPALLSNLTT